MQLGLQLGLQQASQLPLQPRIGDLVAKWSFFGTSENKTATAAELTLQAKTDPDAVNRYFAYRSIAEREKARIIQGLLDKEPKIHVSSEYVDLHASILFDEAISPSTRAITLREPNSTTAENLSHRYCEINNARKALLQAVWHQHSGKIIEQYHNLQATNQAGSHKEQLHERALKRHLLNLMSVGM